MENGDSFNNNVKTPVPGQEVTELPVQMDQNAIEDWNQGAADCVRTSIFAKQQFLVSDACLNMGGIIQKHVANYIHVSSVERLRIFWDKNGGRETVRNTFRKKREAAQNAIKIAFKGKWRH
jgi:hypothetical protein